MNGSSKLSPREIADVLRERIRVGELKADDRLPTQAELAGQFGVERGAIRQALRMLQRDGLLTNVSKGSPPRIASPDPTGAEDPPQATIVALAPRLAEAFAVPHVRIDAVSLSSESLMLALAEPVRLIHEGRVRPESIKVRILVPSMKHHLLYPSPRKGWDHDADLSDSIHQRSLKQRNNQQRVVEHNLNTLRQTHNIDVQVSFRTVDSTPFQKVYLLNGREVLVAHYIVTETTEEIDGTARELHDAWGTGSLLFSFSAGAGQQAFVQESQNWFDALWETIAADLTLS
ncbi:winged helix-turn-helix transcriptional regulator [Streptomyces sp. YC419]|uniref:Winged helix-turn-helix transcriptional regulator n=1 Tax=Streptomyces ureilyticus TaxID=1775131 RepID=A0ABX0DWA9_9ACTN|nr:winged helix-turn-helix transcriptional regulator [Streptomyces ureilyticus]